MSNTSEITASPRLRVMFAVAAAIMLSLGLNFTHFCTRSRKWGSFVIGRKTIKKRMLKQLQAVKMELRKRMHDPRNWPRILSAEWH
jgi:hypothetical protein